VDLERRQAELSSNPPPMPDVHFTMDEGIMSDAISLYGPTKKSADQRWGFVIYRVAFDDDAAWLHCLETLRWCVHRNLANKNPRVFEHLAPYLLWTVVEDRALDGASRGGSAAALQGLGEGAERRPGRDGPVAEALSRPPGAVPVAAPPVFRLRRRRGYAIHDGHAALHGPAEMDCQIPRCALRR